MTVTVIGMWEPDWMDAERTERRLWKQTIEAFEVDAWAMVPANQYVFTSPVQYADMAAALAAHAGPKTFLIRPGNSPTIEQDLRTYQHPHDAIYVFGNSNEHLGGFVTPADDVVSIFTPTPSTFFGCCCLAAVLNDRFTKE